MRTQLEGARHMRDAEPDEELKTLAREEIAALETRETALLDDLRVSLLPRDPNDDRNVIVEIRAGAGGEEAALFATELLRMYSRYAQEHRFQTDLMSLNETGHRRHQGGDPRGRAATAPTAGSSSRAASTASSGCPATESSGRIHTSTATVIVLPEVDEVEVDIDEAKDLRIDVKRSSGPGGQSVNTTDSAVRITHLPTGLVVEIQDEKSQHKNKAKAMAVLRSRLYDLELAKQREAQSAERRLMVGGGDRSEKIRTYNFPDNRVTDHRIGVTIHNVPGVLEGQLDTLIDALVMADQADRLSHLTETNGRSGERRDRPWLRRPTGLRRRRPSRREPGREPAGSRGDPVLRPGRPADRQGHRPRLGPGAQAGQPVPALRPVRRRPPRQPRAGPVRRRHPPCCRPRSCASTASGRCSSRRRPAATTTARSS